MTNVAIFASGRGSNALSIIELLNDQQEVNVNLILTNNQKAGILDIAKEWEIKSETISRNDLVDASRLLKLLDLQQIDFIVLAGFLLKIPPILIERFPIINIHPALLPKYGGKGMYGHHVHEAVKESGDQKSGITIHWVNDNYDEGKIILQKECKIEAFESADEIAAKVLKLEHKFYPEVVLDLGLKINRSK